MVLKCVLVTILIVGIIFLMILGIPKFRFKYKLHKELVKTRKEQQAFRNKLENK